MPSAVRLREDYSAEALWRSPVGRRTLTRAGGFCPWRRFGTGWTEEEQPRSAAWAARRCATGCIAAGPRGLIDNWTAGPKPRLSEEQRAQGAKTRSPAEASSFTNNGSIWQARMTTGQTPSSHASAVPAMISTASTLTAVPPLAQGGQSLHPIRLAAARWILPARATSISWLLVWDKAPPVALT
jgi:hypothetical protein